jgi:hypothetical protein
MKAKIEKWYKLKLWDIAMVRNAAAKGVITAADFEEITGLLYTE